jgi:CBS domain-containing protein
MKLPAVNCRVSSGIAPKPTRLRSMSYGAVASPFIPAASCRLFWRRRINSTGGVTMAIPPTLTVRDVMTKDLRSVETTDKVFTAIKVKTENDIGSVLVTKNEKPMGILTERDILRKVCPQQLCTREITAGEVMSKPLIHIEADAGLGQASSLMALKNVRRLLVMDKGKIVGIVTQKDVIKGTLETFMSLASM